MEGGRGGSAQTRSVRGDSGDPKSASYSQLWREIKARRMQLRAIHGNLTS